MPVLPHLLGAFFPLALISVCQPFNLHLSDSIFMSSLESCSDLTDVLFFFVMGDLDLTCGLHMNGGVLIKQLLQEEEGDLSDW